MCVRFLSVLEEMFLTMCGSVLSTGWCVSTAGREGGRERGREGGREGGKEGGREGGREERREGGRKEGMETSRLA